MGEGGASSAGRTLPPSPPATVISTAHSRARDGPGGGSTQDDDGTHECVLDVDARGAGLGGDGGDGDCGDSGGDVAADEAANCLQKAQMLMGGMGARAWLNGRGWALAAAAYLVELCGLLLHLVGFACPADWLRRRACMLRGRHPGGPGPGRPGRFRAARIGGCHGSYGGSGHGSCGDAGGYSSSDGSYGDDAPPFPGSRVFDPSAPSCAAMHVLIRRHTFDTTFRATLIIIGAAAVHLSLMSLANIFDWDGYLFSHGRFALEDPRNWQTLYQTHVVTLLTLLQLAFLTSRWCTERTFQIAFTAYLLLMITIYCLPFVEIQYYDYFALTRVGGCSSCVSEEERRWYTNSGGAQTITYPYPAQSADERMRLYGLVLKTRRLPTNDTNFEPRMAPTLEAWLRLLIYDVMHDIEWSVLYAVIITALCPTTPLQTAFLTAYLMALRWWETSTTISWSFSNLENQCCSLSEPLPFSFYYFMIALSVVILYRQHGAMSFALIKKRANDHLQLRIEQLAREKERLEYERSLERKLRLVADALRRAEQPAYA